MTRDEVYAIINKRLVKRLAMAVIAKSEIVDWITINHTHVGLDEAGNLMGEVGAKISGGSLSNKINTPTANSAWKEKIKEMQKAGVKTEAQVCEAGTLVSEALNSGKYKERLDSAMAKEQQAFADFQESLKVNAFNSAEHQAACEAWKQAQADTWETKRECIRDALSEIREMGSNCEQKWTSGTPKGIKGAIHDVYSYLPKDWVDQSSAISMCGVDDRRGYYNSFTGTIALTEDEFRGRNLDNDYFAAATHEIGHRIESLRPGVLAMEKDFYERRTAGEKLQQMKGYSKGEKSRIDHFLSPYMGKDYGGRGYELLSMGLERLYAGGKYDQSQNLDNDPDFKNFILGVLATQ